MIKPQELRIGNLVTDEFYDSCKTIIEVESINKKGINLLIEDDGDLPELAEMWVSPEFTFDKLHPIPLTEEWLIKFGAKNCGEWGLSILLDDENYTETYLLIDNPSWDTNTFYEVDYGTSKKMHSINAETDELKTIAIIQYVHQLQNLVFSLTGEELTIKE